MADLFVTPHAIQRYRERVADVSPIEVCKRLNSPAMIKAAEFGAPYVRLAGGQRAVISKGRVITILPKEHSAGSLSTARDHLHERWERHAAG